MFATRSEGRIAKLGAGSCMHVIKEYFLGFMSRNILQFCFIQEDNVNVLLGRVTRIKNPKCTLQAFQ